ncbi:MAG: aminoacyl-tRNA hydrolase [Candidatus Altiarchaeales archaeon A3]|nr:MAG: aminoacyl-tRNA hydrolase [Candidatus Altiarchaeales archaeon A3]
MKQVIVVRNDLKKLSRGKLAAQVAHAAISSAEISKFKKQWIMEGQKKVVVKCECVNDLLEIYQKSKNSSMATSLIQDAGLTEIPPGTITCVGIGPDEEEKIDKITKNLKLL